MDMPSPGGLGAEGRGRAGRLGAWLVAALTALLVSATPALAQTDLFVATTGSDAANNNCQTQSSPCATITHAVSQAAGGDTIRIAGGTYGEAITTGLDLDFAGAGSTGAGATVIDSTGLHASALALSGTDSVSDLTLKTDDAGIGGALNVSGSGAVTATGLAVATDPGANAGSDGIDAGGASLTVSDSTITATNSDTAVASTSSTSCVVQDGSAIEITAGTLSLSNSTVRAVQGIALRIHGSTSGSSVLDSLLESSGAEDLSNSATGYAYDQWPVIEAAAGPLTLTADTVYNATLANTDDYAASSTTIYAHTDALWVPGPCDGSTPSGDTVTTENTILQAQPVTIPVNQGADIDTGNTVTATNSAYTTVATIGSGSAPPAGSGGNVAGDTGLTNPGTGDFTLAAGSALLGAGDPTAVQNGETDLAGNPRDHACSAGPAIVNIGAFEAAAPSCPVALSSGNSTGALTQLSGAGNCITGDTTGASGCGSASEPGMTGGTPPAGTPTPAYDTAPTDAVQSPDGKNVYVATEDPADNGVDIAELSRAADGSLSELAAPDDCVEPPSGTGGCGSTESQLLYALGGSSTPVFEPTRMAISPDGKSLYVDNGNGIAEFSRDTATGAITPLPSGDCIAWLNSATCQFTDQEQVATAAAMLVSPNGDDVYVATLNECSFAVDPGGPPGDNQSPDCNNDRGDGFFASADIAVLKRDPSTGALTPSLCYDNSATSELGGQAGCVSQDASGNDFDGLYWITSMAMSPDNQSLYVTSEVGSASSAQPGDPFGLLSRDPGEVTELSVAPSSGALSQIVGRGACVTAGSGCGVAGDTGQSELPGVADPQQVVLSPDGLNAYVTGAQYTMIPTSQTHGGENGSLVGTTLVQLARDPSSGILSPISGAGCFAGYHEACGTANGPGSNVTQVPGLTGAEALTISPDGGSVYATAENDSVNSAVVEFSRDQSSGELTPLSPPNLCLSDGTAPGATAPRQCGSDQPAGLSDSVSPLPGGVLVSPDCQSALVMSDGLAEFSRSSPGGGCLSTVAFSEPSLAFDAEPNVTTASQTDTVTNRGAGKLVFGAGALTLAGANPADFALTGDSCSGQTVPPSGTCTFSVDFTAPSSGAFSAEVVLADNAPDSPQSVALRGTGGQAAISLDPTSLGFGSASAPVFVNTSQTQFETITNSGSASLVLGSLSLSGAQQSLFAIASDTCSGQTLPQSGSCKVSIKYTPTQAGHDSAQLNVPDNAAASPQTVALSGIASRFPIQGTVLDTGQTPAVPVQGASISACPENGSGTNGNCQSATSATDGSYGLGVTPGTWLLQLTPPGSSNLFGAQAIVVVTAGKTIVRNFDLTPPTGLSGGIVVNGQTLGVPVVNWEQPISIQVPLHLPTSGARNTTNVFAFITGLTGAGGSGSDTGLDLAALSMFGIHYGSNGRPDAIGPSFSTQLDCRGTPSPCAAPLSTTSLTGTTGATAADARRTAATKRGAGGSASPIARAAGCPPAPVNMSIMPGELNTIPTPNGVHFVMDFGGSANGQWDLGTASTYQPPQFAPPPVDPDFPIASAALALPGKAVNMMTNALVSPYNSWVQQTQDLATAQRVSDPALAAQLNANAAIDMSLETLSASAHGATELVQKGLVGMVEGHNTADNALTIQGLLDCPPKSSSIRIDPSGTVQTKTGIPVAGAKVVLTRSGTAKGKQAQVPNGSQIMSVSNRRNPDHTSALGVFHWDVLPGFYQVKASRSGCRAVKGHSLLGLTPVLAVPPPRKNLLIELRCPKLKRTATKLTLRLGSKGKHGALLWAAIKFANRKRPIPATEAPGQIAFAIQGIGTRRLPIDVRHDWAFFDLPLTKHPIQLVTATFSGNGYLASSTARLKNP